MIALKLIPLPYKIGAVVLVVGLLAAGHAARVSAAYDRGHDAAVGERAARDAVAVLSRVTENVKVAEKQDKINLDITKVKNEEIAPIIKRVYVDRVRVGPGICGPTSPAEAQSSPGSHGEYPSGRLVREDVERDLRALIVAVEEDLATGRACQAFVTANGLTP